MASYTEIWTLFNDSVLQEKVAVACIVAANTIAGEDDQTENHANRLKWSKRVFQDPNGVKDDMLKVLLAKNKAFTLAQIQGATDESIQTAVDAAVNVFADGVA